MATLRWTKSFKKGDLYCAALPAGTRDGQYSKNKNVWPLLTFLVHMRFDVPVGIDVARASLLDTGRLYLFEAPLWEIDSSSLGDSTPSRRASVG